VTTGKMGARVIRSTNVSTEKKDATLRGQREQEGDEAFRVFSMIPFKKSYKSWRENDGIPESEGKRKEKKRKEKKRKEKKSKGESRVHLQFERQG
jgi:hypothetical protein